MSDTYAVTTLELTGVEKVSLAVSPQEQCGRSVSTWLENFEKQRVEELHTENLTCVDEVTESPKLAE